MPIPDKNKVIDMNIEVPKNIYESQYFLYSKLFYDSQLKQLKINPPTDDTIIQRYHEYTMASRDSFKSSRMISVEKSNKEINRKFYDAIELSNILELMRFFKTSNNNFVTQYNNILTLDEYIKLLDIEIEEGDH